MNCLQDLYRVGKSKPVGYLPLSTIREASNEKELIKWATQVKLSHQLFYGHQCNIGSGALFIYDRGELQDFLICYSMTLLGAGVPTDPDSYITYIAKNHVMDKKAFRIVGLSFADRRFRK